MKRRCKVSGCFSPASGYGVYCSKHKANDRRHGDPSQKGVTTAELKPYRAMITARIQKNVQSSVWQKADHRWDAVVQLAEGVLNRFASGRPGISWERKAAIEVVKLSKHVAAREIVETVLAMYLMLDLEPRRFSSDRAFRTQMVRRVRGLSKINANEWLDKDSGKIKRAYIELPPRVTRPIGEWLASALGGIGVYLAKLEKETFSERDLEARELAQALEGVQ